MQLPYSKASQLERVIISSSFIVLLTHLIDE